jgi:hypothetical protein
MAHLTTTATFHNRFVSRHPFIVAVGIHSYPVSMHIVSVFLPMHICKQDSIIAYASPLNMVSWVLLPIDQTIVGLGKRMRKSISLFV